MTVSFEFGGVTVASYFDRPSVENSFASRFNATWVPTKLTLIVFNVTSDDKGEYLCRVQANARGLKTWQRKIEVDVLGKFGDKASFVAYSCSVCLFLSLNAYR